MLSIIVPVYNEEDTISEVVSRLCNVPIEGKEIIVVNDGSTDKTLNRLERIARISEDLKVVNLPKNKGKGFAVRKGVEAASKEYIVFQDADMEYPPSNIVKMFQLIERDSSLDMVVGVRSLSWDLVTSISFGSFFANKVISKLVDCPDTFSGHRIVKRDVYNWLNLKSDGFEVETELTLKLIKNGFNVGFVPIKYIPRSRKEGKKIGFIDFVKIMNMYFYVSVLDKKYRKEKFVALSLSEESS